MLGARLDEKGLGAEVLKATERSKILRSRRRAIRPCGFRRQRLPAPARVRLRRLYDVREKIARASIFPVQGLANGHSGRVAKNPPAGRPNGTRLMA